MNLTNAILIAGITISIGGSIGLLISAVLAASASGAPAESERLNEDINRLGPPAESADGQLFASGASADHAVAVLLARILNRSEAGKTVGR